MDTFASYIGRIQEAADVVTDSPLRRLAALLDHESPPWRPREVPPVGHWLFHLPEARQSQLGNDGHAALGGFLPHFEQSRRMWAGSRIDFLAPLPIVGPATRLTRIDKIEEKTGRSGSMVFVTLAHEVRAGDTLCIREEQDLVYRAPAKPGETSSPPVAPEAEAADATRKVTPDAIALFRYSALTFNGHRIHYDADYTRDVESYPALVIHGPLVATYLIDHFLRNHPGADVARFAFRNMQPMFLGDTLTLHLRGGGPAFELWVTKQDGSMTVKAQIATRNHR